MLEQGRPVLGCAAPPFNFVLAKAMYTYNYYYYYASQYTYT